MGGGRSREGCEKEQREAHVTCRCVWFHSRGRLFEQTVESVCSLLRVGELGVDTARYLGFFSERQLLHAAWSSRRREQQVVKDCKDHSQR